MKKNSSEPNMKSTMFFINIFAVFLLLVNPASHKANPGCIQKTNMAANNIHTVSNDNPNSSIIFLFLSGVIILRNRELKFHLGVNF